MARPKRRLVIGRQRKERKCATDDHGCHSLSDTLSLNLKVYMLIQDSFDVKEWSTEVLSEEDKGASVGQGSAGRVVLGRVGKNKGSRSGIVCVLSGEGSRWMSWTWSVCGKVQ